ncbi:DUF362 domain-containing protein [Desulfospira joergensenii]|uniref:DUF362 domain-containing protein n=1 Tax=Desulfospira joergensenii TaxID=53329 RepID=UPI0003B433D0|nr:DUF362 domain-containing protein [Desulfospira joergensenii]
MNKPDSRERREFLKKSLSAGVVAGASWLRGSPDILFAGTERIKAPDLVAVKNGEPDAMFHQAITMMGGMEKFVKKGQTVLVKPNISFPRKPEIGATTNPLLVKSIVEHCFGAGAKKVYVFDNVGFSSYGIAKKCYKTSGIEEAARSAGAIVAPGDNERYYQKVNISGARTLVSTKVHELVLEADVFINVPILKNHTYTYQTIAMKNLMGVVWDRMKYHELDLEQSIADFCLFRTPDLNVVDAYRVMKRFGPGGSTTEHVALEKTLLISQDIVAVDAAASKVYGMEPDKVRYIRLGHELNIGNMNLNELSIQRHVMGG